MDLSDSLTSLTKNEGMSKLLIFLNKKNLYKTLKHTKKKSLYFFTKFVERIAHSLIWHEGPERIANSRSFVISDLSDSLTDLICLERPEQFAHLS